MSSTTSFLSLVKQALDEHWSVGILNDNLDKIDAAAAKTNKSLSGASLSALETAIIAVADAMSNGEIVCGYCNPGFVDTNKGFDGSKGSYMLSRNASGVYIFHAFLGTSEAIGYYYSSAWHWDSPANKIGVRLYNNTNQVAFDASTMAKIGTWITTHYEQNRWVAVRCTNNGSSNPVFGASEFGLIYCLSSTNYGWGILMSDSGSLAGGILFGQLSAGTWKWYKPTVTQV